MEIEHVAGKRFAARWAAQHERELPVRGGLLGEIVVHAEGRLALVVHEVLRHRGARIGRDVLHRRRVGRRRDDDDGVLHRALFLQARDDRRHRGRLLANGDVHANDALTLLVDDRVNGDGRLAGAAIADDQLALSASDRNHRVDGLDAGLERLLHGLADDDARRLAFDLPRMRRGDIALPVDGATQCIHNTSDQLGTNRNLQHSARATHLVALLELEVVAEDDGADVVLFEIEREGGDGLARFAGVDLEHLAGHGLLEAVNASNSVFHFEDGANFLHVEVVEVSGFDFAKQDVLDLAGAKRGIGCHTVGLWGRCGGSL